MNQPSLLFNEEPFHDSIIADRLLQFRAKGYVVLPDIFVRGTVDGFLAEAMSAVRKDDQAQKWILPDDRPELVWPLRSKRIRQVLGPALSPSKHMPRVSVFEMVWRITDNWRAQDWHKDRHHEGMPGKEYHFPDCVHVGMYFRDMSIEEGPTEIIPGSHQDQSLNPYNGAPVERFIIRKEDAVLWDQRCWHRASVKHSDGLRLFAFYGFNPVQAYGSTPPRSLPRAWAQAWFDASSPEDEIFLGGKWSAVSVLAGLSEAAKKKGGEP